MTLSVKGNIMRNKICPHCQSENPEIAVFCKKCGALFRGEPEIKDTMKERQKLMNILAVVLCAILLVVAFVIFKAGSAPKKADATTLPTEVTTAATTLPTTLPTTTVPVPESTTETTTEKLTLPTLPTTQATTTKPTTTAAPSQEEIQAICDDYNTLIENIKSREWDLTVHKTIDIGAEITDFSLGTPSDTINALISRAIPQTDETVSFSGGVSTADSSITLSDYIPPSADSGSSVSASNVKSAKTDSNGNITLTFRKDESSFADGQTVVPPYVSTATNPLDFADFPLGSIAVSKATITYPETVITAEVDSDGDLVKLTITQPVDMVCTGGVGTLTADIGLRIDTVSVYEITY